MPEIAIPAVVVSAVAGLALSSTYYTVLAAPLATVSEAAARSEQLPPWKIAVELLRGLVLATIVAGIASEAGIVTWSDGLLLGICLWVGFPAVLWTGALIWEQTPWKLAAIHAGDWLVKLAVVGVIVSVWQ